MVEEVEFGARVGQAMVMIFLEKEVEMIAITTRMGENLVGLEGNLTTKILN